MFYIYIYIILPLPKAMPPRMALTPTGAAVVHCSAGGPPAWPHSRPRAARRRRRR